MANVMWRLGYDNQQVAEATGCFVIGPDFNGDMRREQAKRKEEHLSLVETQFRGGSD
jgi:hypothetical protein